MTHISVFKSNLMLALQARVSHRTVDGRTALHIASQYGRKEIVELLLARGKALELVAKEKLTSTDGPNKLTFRFRP